MDLSPGDQRLIVITIVYTILLFWGSNQLWRLGTIFIDLFVRPRVPSPTPSVTATADRMATIFVRRPAVFF
jgi:hypothetical protein